MSKTIKQKKLIIKNLIQDIKELKKYNFYSIEENKKYYLNLCDVIIQSLKNYNKKIKTPKK